LVISISYLILLNSLCFTNYNNESILFKSTTKLFLPSAESEIQNDIDKNNSTFKPEEFSQGVKNNSTSKTKEFSQWVDDVYCVEKSFPNFWQELQKMVG
jgi:hypothetical protein